MTGKDAVTNPRRPGRLSRLLIAALFLGAGLIVIRSLAPQTLGETARRQFLAQLRQHYSDLSIDIGRGRFDPDVGLIFEDIVVSEPGAASFQFRAREMLRVARLTVVADLDAEKLLEKEIPMVTRRIVLEGLHANAWLETDGNLSLTKLYPLPSLGPAAPRIEVRDAKVRLIGGRSQDRPIDIQIAHATLQNRTLSTGAVDKTITVKGHADFANHFVMQCELAGGATDLRIRLDQARLSRDLFARLPSQWSGKIREARNLDCICDATLSFFRSPTGQVNYQARTNVYDGRFADPRLPKPITELRGVVVADPSGLTIETSQAMLGDSVIRMTGKIHGSRWPCDADLKVTARGLLLDEQLASAIPGSMRSGWDLLQPIGRVDVDASLKHVGTTWTTPQATLICKGVDVRYEKFPYPIQQLVGRVVVNNGIATCESLNGRIGGNRMQCAFRLPIKPGITNEKSFVVATDGPVPIDNTLIRALTPRGSPTTGLESFVRSLNPRGSMHLVSGELITDADGKHTRNFDLRIVDGHLQYKQFAYPLYNVEGAIKVNDDLVKLVGFRATNANAGLILCDGGYRLDRAKLDPKTVRISETARRDDSQSLLALNFRASNVPMDNSLRSSLPPEAQHVWDAISPSGVLDNLNVILGKQGSGPLSLQLTAKQNVTNQVTSRTLRLMPSSLPYRLDVTGGTVRFDGSKVTIDSISARHDASTISADGGCTRDASGRWELLLNVHSGSRIHPDAELVASLPLQMREAMRSLQLRGPVNLRGQTRILMSDDTHPEPAIDWNLDLQLEGNRIGDVGPVHSLRGEIEVAGSRDDLGLRANGQVKIDSMHVNDLQITRIRGPFAIRGDRLKLGLGEIDRSRRPTAETLNASDPNSSIQGQIFDGTLQLAGDVILSRASFDVELTVTGAELPTLLADYGFTDNDLTGTFSGKTLLQGYLGSTDLLKGSGAARVTGANLYQLPLIVQVLNQLRITPTEDVAFTDGEVEFSIFGDTVTFSKMQMWGDLVALHGGGTLDRRRELDLTFNTRVSPQNSFTRVLSPLNSNRYTLWTIDVRGPLSSPEIERRSFEGVGETLERLFPVISDGEDTETTPEKVGISRWFRR